MLRTVILGFVLSLTGPHPEALAKRLTVRFELDRSYDACMAQAGQDDWQCETIYEPPQVVRSRQLQR